jgi:uncharacterized membrane protein
LKSAVLYFFVVLLVAGGANHLFNPKFYNRFIPESFPKWATNIVSGIVEIALGIGLLFEATKHWSAVGILVMMIVFLPLHIIDLFREKPAIGSRTLAIIRLPVQFLLIWGAWWLT